MSSFSIHRACSADDMAAVAGLFQAYAASLDVDLDYQNFPEELAGLPGAYAPPSGALLLACRSSGAPLGCVALRPLGLDRRCEMKRLFVAPAGRGLGLGRQLVEAIVTEAAGIGYREICLDTLPGMTTAIALYWKSGFHPIPPYYHTPIDGTVFMGKTL